MIILMNNVLEEFCGDNLTVYNHNNGGNPHEQYVTNSSEIAIRPYDISTENYFKLCTVLLDKNELDNNNQFMIGFDVYEMCGCRVENDDKWELLLKVGNSKPVLNDNNYGLQIKLKGKEKRCIAIIDKVVINEEVRKEDGDLHSIETAEVEKIRCELFIEIQNEIRFIKRFLNTNIDNKYFTIYNRTHSIEKQIIDEKLTEEEIQFYKDKLVNTEKRIKLNEEEKENIEIQYRDDIKKLQQNRIWNQNSRISLEKEKKYCEHIISISNNEENLVKSKIISRTDDGIIHYNIPKADDGIRYIKLFDIDMSSEFNYNGIFEMFINYSNEFIHYGNKYIKFIINAYGDRNGNSYFNIEAINKLNINNDDLFVLKNDNKYSIFFKDLYPSNISIKSIINNDYDYRIFSLPVIDEFTKFIPNYKQKINIGEKF